MSSPHPITVASFHSRQSASSLSDAPLPLLFRRFLFTEAAPAYRLAKQLPFYFSAHLRISFPGPHSEPRFTLWLFNWRGLGILGCSVAVLFLIGLRCRVQGETP